RARGRVLRQHAELRLHPARPRRRADRAVARALVGPGRVRAALTGTSRRLGGVFEAMRRSAHLLLLALALPGCGASKHAVRPVRLAHGDGISYAIRSGWHAAPRSLTPHLLNPKELL